MAKRKGNIDSKQVEAEIRDHRPSRSPGPVIPTGDRRHTAKIREGAQSSEIYCRNPKRREELGLPPIPDPESIFVEEIRA